MFIILQGAEFWSIVDAGVDDGRFQAALGDDDRFQAARSWSLFGRYGEVASAYWTLHVSHAGEASTLQTLIDAWWPGTFQIYSARETQMVQFAMVGAAVTLMSGYTAQWMSVGGMIAPAGRRRRRALRDM